MRTYGTVKFAQRDDRRAWGIMHVAPHVAISIKRLFPKVPTYQTGVYQMPDNPATCADILWFMQRYPLVASESDLERLNEGKARFLAEQARIDAIIQGNYSAPVASGFKSDMQPWPYQMQAAEIAVSRKSLLIMDDVGLGKTISGIAAVDHGKMFPCAVVVQAHLAEQWQDEFIAPFTNHRCHVIKGRSLYQLPPAEFYVFRYSNISGWVDVASTGLFKSVIFDEVQELRTGKTTLKGKSAHVFAKHAAMRIGLSATPIYNYGEEIHPIIDLIEPDALGSHAEFVREWCTQHGTHHILKDADAFGHYLKDTGLVIRRTEEDVKLQMPQVNTLPIEVEYDQDVDAAAEDEMRTIARRVIAGSFTERGQAARELDIKARRITGLAKAKAVAGIVKMIASTGEKVLLAGWHRDVYNIWLQELAEFKPLMYTGSETASAKKRAKKEFIETDALIMIISLRSGAGLDGLQKVCSKVVLGELDWSPQVHKQLIGRLRRRGQKDVVDAIYTHANGGSDPIIVEMLGLKSSQSHGVVDPGQSAPVRVTDETRLIRLAQMVLQPKS